MSSRKSKLGTRISYPEEVDSDEDPIVATYNVFLKPPLPAHQRIVMLSPHNQPGIQPRVPSELRLKPAAGMLELDVPMDLESPNYNRERGMKWGRCMKESPTIKATGTHGVEAGFGITAAAASQKMSRTRKTEDDDEEEELSWDEAVRRDHVLRNLTWGGQCIVPDCGSNRQCYVGVFQGDNLHLTPLTSECQMGVKRHHIDAEDELARIKLEKLKQGDAPTTSGAGKEGGGGAAAARALMVSAKSGGDSDADPPRAETMSDLLRAIALEPFRRMEYFSEDTDAAWQAYKENLLMHPPAAGGKGKGKDVPRAGGDDGSLVDRVPHLKNDWVEEDFLAWKYPDKYPAYYQRKKEEAREKQEEAAEAVAQRRGKGKEKAALNADLALIESPSKKNRPGRPKGSTSTRGGRGGKAKAGSSRTTAMDID